jgi:dye decolorizing peroxidase
MSSPSVPRSPAGHPSPEPDGTGEPSARRPGRRAFLGGAGLLGAGGVVGGTAGVLVERAAGPSTTQRDRTRALAAVRPGTIHQPGITERSPAHLTFAAYDLVAGTPAATRASLRALLGAWTRAGGDLMAADPPAGAGQTALGLAPSALTVTIGLGASALRRAGLAAAIPAQLAPIPAFAHDQLDPARGDGDLALQICAEDPIVAAAAARYLHTRAAGRATGRWVQHGFRATAAAAADPNATPRNLMGQLDGTDDPTPGTAQFDYAVWAQGTPAWMTGGSYLVARRIQMLLDRWDLITLAGQEKVIGRTKVSGAPLSGGTEHTAPDFSARTADGALAIPANAHIRLTHPRFTDGVRMHRRGYSYDDGLDATGQPDAGLFFLAYQTDPRTAFTAIQTTLDRADALSTFIRHTASALFAVPGAAPRGGYVGQQLLES